MRSYAELEMFKPTEIEKWKEAVVLTERVPDRIFGELVRCHELARAVGKLLELPVQDGYYSFVEHSWLWLWPYDPDDPYIPNVLDVYVPGRVPQVQLVHTNSSAFPREYRRGNGERDDIRNDALEEILQYMTGLRDKETDPL